MKSRAVEARENYVRDLMYTAQRRLGIRNQKRMAEQFGMKEGTYKTRLAEPGDMKLKDIWNLEAVCRHAGLELDPEKIIRGVQL